MELPPELVGIIREFSKPVFTYVKEYKKVLEIENVYQWPELKEKLYKKDILPVVKNYLECAKQKDPNFISMQFANARWNLLNAVFDGNPRCDWWKEHSRWWNEDEE